MLSCATRIPAAPPMSASSALSVSICLTMAAREAPSAVRSATSPRTARGASQQQVGYVRAGDQKHDPDRPPQQKESAPKFADHVFPNRPRPSYGGGRTSEGVRARSVQRSTPSPASACRGRNARLQSPEGHQRALHPLQPLCIERCGQARDRAASQWRCWACGIPAAARRSIAPRARPVPRAFQ